MLEHFDKENKENGSWDSADEQPAQSGNHYWAGQAPPPHDGQKQPGQEPPPPYGPYSGQRPGGFYRGPGSGPYQPPGYNGPNRSYGQGQGPGYGYNPYQYSPNSGWQQGRKPEQKYEWKFEDYDKLHKKKETKKNSRGLVVFAVSILSLFSVGLIAFSGYSIWEYLAHDGSNASESLPLGDEQNGQETDRLEITSKPQISSAPTVSEDGKLSIPEVAERVSPSVVGVIQYQNSMRFYEASGIGSGIIMSQDGYIITNAHVVNGGVAYKVELHDGDVYEATLVGADTLTDLAVLKIDAQGLVPAEFGDSNNLRVGETVIAIGNPAGMELAGSVTRGIVSALNRKVETGNYSFTYIQTDAAINPGNSGGALVNEYGQVIGINSSKIVASGYEGIGFAIPITDAKPIIDDILKNGRVTGRVMLGITCRPIDEVDAKTYNVKMGLEIIEISPESDLSNQDIMQGDIITHIDGERVFELSDVRRMLEGHKAGDVITMTIYRKLSLTRDTTFDVSVRLIEDQGQ